MAASPVYDSDEDLFADEDELEVRRRDSGGGGGGARAADEADTRRVERLVDALKSLMTGVPPPPQITDLVSFSVSHILELWYTNRDRLLWKNILSETDDDCKEETEAEGVVEPTTMNSGNGEQVTSNVGVGGGGGESQVREADNEGGHELTEVEVEPGGKSSDAGGTMKLGINYNTCRACEELESLRCRYSERYVGCETDAFTKSWSAEGNSVPLTASAKKRARLHGWTMSPGRRLSYLARRRNTFGVHQLRHHQPTPNVLMVDIRRKTKGGGGGGAKSCAVKAAPNSGKKSKRKSPGRMVKSCPKRALFQSPDEPSNCQPSTTPTDRCRPVARRMLWPSDGRRRNDEDADDHDLSITGGGGGGGGGDRKRRKSSCSRSLSFADHTAQTPANFQLSTTHKQKLLWAVSNALKCEGIEQSDARFRPVGTALFKQCGRNWLYRTMDPSSSTSSSATSGMSTSDTMLEMAKAYLPGILAEMKAAKEQQQQQQKQQQQSRDESVHEVSIVSSLVTDHMLNTTPTKANGDEEAMEIGEMAQDSPTNIENQLDECAQQELTTTHNQQQQQQQRTADDVGEDGDNSLKRKRNNDDNEGDVVGPPEKTMKFCVTRESVGDERSSEFTRVVLDVSSTAQMDGQHFIPARSLNTAENNSDRVIRVRRIGCDMVELFIPNRLLVEDDSSGCVHLDSDYVDISQVAEKVDSIAKAFQLATTTSTGNGTGAATTPTSNNKSSIIGEGDKSASSSHRLSDAHRKKLVWAATKALQESHTSPRLRRSRLVSLLKKLRSVWSSMVASGAANRRPANCGTSDRMLDLARSILMSQQNGYKHEDCIKVRLQLRSADCDGGGGESDDSVVRRLGSRLELTMPNTAIQLTGYETTVDTDQIAARVATLVGHLVDDGCTVRLTDIAATTTTTTKQASVC